MQYIEIQSQGYAYLRQAFHSIQDCLISNDMGDALYSLTTFNQSYDDESSVAIITKGINQEANLETVLEILTESLPQEYQEDFKQEEHITLHHNQETLSLHLNDATITAIYHNTGQF